VSGRVRTVGVGAGGHSKVVVETLDSAGRADIVGLVDPDQRLWGTRVMGLPVLGGDDLLPTLRQEGVTHAFIGVGSADSLTRRCRLYESVRALGFVIVDAIHPSVYVSPAATIGTGVTLLPFAVVHTAARLGANVLVNTRAVVEHDCTIGDHVHLATGAVLAAAVQVGAQTHIGAGAVVRQGVRIGSRVIVGVGAVVVRNVDDDLIVVGNPARVLRTRSSHE
jgi:UDP-perosamine 4-acetyltransferase